MPLSPQRAALRRGWTGLGACLALWLAGCGGGGGSERVVSHDDGSVQVMAGQVEKGPLLRGSVVTINTLTTAPVTLASGTTTVTGSASLPALVPTGASFTMEVKDDWGGFAPQSAAIFQAPFIETTAQGYYFNEITGQRSDDLLVLRGLSNLKSDTAINVNLLTDLSRERTLKLARTAAGTGSVTSALFNTARRQAQDETLRAFGIGIAELGSVAAFSDMDLRRLSSDTTARPADQILLALSALALKAGQDGAGLSNFVNRFESDVADNGVIDDATLREQILQASATTDFDAVAAHMNRHYATTRFAGADLAQWVDRSGGTVGLIGKNVEYGGAGLFTPGATLTSRALTIAASATPACYGVEINDAGAGSAQMLLGGTAAAAGQRLPVNTSTAASLQIRLTAQGPNAVAYLVRWNTVSGACSTTQQPGKTRLRALAAVTSDVGRFLATTAERFSRCFALNVNQRVLAVDNTVPASDGGPEVTQVAPACQDLVASADKMGTNYLNNGYRAGQTFAAMLQDTALTKTARITQVEIVRAIAEGSAPLAPKPTLVAMLRYVDRYGRLGSFSIVAQRHTGTSPETGDWWITGNQQPVDITIKPLTRKFTSITNYTTATPSVKEHFRTGIGFFITARGPGSTLADGTQISAVRISGPGIPGLVYIPPVQEGQTWMDISNQAGDVGAASAKRCSATVPATGAIYRNCPYLWINRSTTVTPSSAAPVLRTPGSSEGSCASATSVTQTCAWGGTWSPSDVSANVTRGVVYTAEVFYGGRTTPTYTLHKTLIAPTTALVKAHQAGWVALTSDAITAARPQAGQTTLDLAWSGHVNNRVEVSSATVSLANSGATVATPDEQVLRGSSQVTINTGGEIQHTPLANATQQRAILLNQRTWDGSGRSIWFSYESGN